MGKAEIAIFKKLVQCGLSEINLSPSELDTHGYPAIQDILAWLGTQCERLRATWSEIEKLSQNPGINEAESAKLIGRLKNELFFHITDEADGLFPLLSLRARKDDDVSQILAKLSENHKIASSMRGKLITRLEAKRQSGGDSSCDAELIAYLFDLAARERHHLAVVNAVILPIARLRLTGDDLITLRASVIARLARKPI